MPFPYRIVGSDMYKWSIVNGSVQQIQDLLTREEGNFTNDVEGLDQAEEDTLKEIESQMTMEQANSVPKTGKLEIRVGK